MKKDGTEGPLPPVHSTGPLELAHVLFMDIVSYSSLPIDHQSEVVQHLQDIVHGIPEFQRALADELICLPTGDGMALVFFGDPTTPVQCARQIAITLRRNPLVQLRMGIHTGPVYRLADINTNRNVAGGGINFAQRVMDCGDGGHILASKAVAEVLLQLSNWRTAIHDLGEHEVKNGVRVHVFNVFNEEFGNPQAPSRIARKVTGPARLRLPWIAAGAATLLLSTGLMFPSVRNAVSRRFVAPTPAADQKALRSTGKFVAVLPFRMAKDEADFQYIAEGIVDSIGVNFSQLKDVHPASSAAVAKANLSGSPSEIAASLGTKLLIQGSVQVSDQVTVVVSIDEPSTGRRLWSKGFSGLKQDLFNLQDQVYLGLLSALHVRLSDVERAKSIVHQTENLKAYELYLKGRSLVRSAQRDEKVLKQAFDLFESATGKDPNFAPAYSAMADAAVNLYNIKKDASWATQALDAANRANVINSNLAEVHFSLGQVYNVTGKSVEAVAELKRALELAPNSDEGYRRLGSVYVKTGQKAEAVKTLQQAVDANPYYWPNHYSLGTAYYQFGDNERALKALQRAAELEPNNATIWTTIGATQYRQSNWNESIAAFKKVLELKPSGLIYTDLGTAYFFLGRYDEACANFERVVDMKQEPRLVETLADLADCYRWSGQRDKANVTYNRAIELATKAYRENPRDATKLSMVALCYAKKGDLAKGFELIHRASLIAPDSVDVIFDDAEIQAIAGHQPEALAGIRRAFQKGLPPEAATHDIELGALRSYPEFHRLVEEFSSNRTIGSFAAER